MTENTTIMGAVVEPTDGTAVFSFYSGPVSIRDRGGYLEVAFFAPTVTPELPAEGLLDGTRVTVTGVRTRELDPSTPSPKRSAAHRSIIAIVTPA